LTRNPLGSFRAGRVSTIKDNKGNKIGSAIGPHPVDLAHYKGAQPATIDDVVRVLKHAKKNLTNPLVDLRAWGKFYKDPNKGLKWVSTPRINIDTLISLSEDYAESGFSPEDFAEEVFDFVEKGDDHVDFVLQWFVKYS
jgi:hypothetical protein